LEKEKELNQEAIDSQLRNFPTNDLLSSLMFLKNFFEEELLILEKFQEIVVIHENQLEDLRSIIELKSRPSNQNLKKIRTEINKLQKLIKKIQADIDHPDEEEDVNELKTKLQELKLDYQKKLKQLREEIAELSKYGKTHFPELVINSSDLKGFFELGDTLIEDFPLFDLGKVIASSNHNIYKVEYDGATFVLKEYLGMFEKELDKAKKEIKILKRLSQHPNIIKLLGVYFDQHKSVIYLKSPFYPSTLSKVIEKQGKFNFFFIYIYNFFFFFF